MDKFVLFKDVRTIFSALRFVAFASNEAVFCKFKRTYLYLYELSLMIFIKAELFLHSPLLWRNGSKVRH